MFRHAMLTACHGYGFAPALATLSILLAGSGRALAESPDIVWMKQGHASSVWSIASSPDGELLASGGRDRVIQLWRARDGQPLRTLVGHDSGVVLLGFSPDGQMLASGSGSEYYEDIRLIVWRISDGAVLWTRGFPAGAVTAVAFSPDGTMLAVGTWARRFPGELLVLRAQDGALLQKLAESFSWHSVAFSPNGELLAGSDSLDVWLWRVSDWQPLKRLRHPQQIQSVAFAPHGHTLATAPRYGEIWLWRISDGSLLRVLSGHGADVNTVAFSPDARTLGSAGDDETIRIWRVWDGAPLKTYDTDIASDRPRMTLLASGDLFAYGRSDGFVVVARYPYPPCPGDVNIDKAVNQSDLALLLSDYGCSDGDCPGDVDADGDTDQADLAGLLARYGTTCP